MKADVISPDKSSAKKNLSTTQISQTKPNTPAAVPVWCQDNHFVEQQRSAIHQTISSSSWGGVIQPKLRVGNADDACEREADSVADAVMAMPSAPLNVQVSASQQIQCKPQPASQKSDHKNRAAASAVAVTARNGQPLPQTERQFFEPRFGVDFSAVTVHNDSQSHRAAQSISAKAYTWQNHIVFAHDQFKPNTQEGRHLLAHELTHVVQQSSKSVIARQELDWPDINWRERAEHWRERADHYRQRADEETTELLDRAERRIDRELERGERYLDEAVEQGEELLERGGELAEQAESGAEQAADEAGEWWDSGSGDISSISFDGSTVTLHGTGGMSTAARSGLLPSHRNNTEGLDYTQPQYQDVPNKGPLPEGSYYINPSEVDNNPPSSAWGRRRVRLHESLGTRAWRSATTERTGGFYLHGDGGNDGTAGCIGVINLSKNVEVHRKVEANSARIPVTVNYPAAASPDSDSEGTVQRSTQHSTQGSTQGRIQRKMATAGTSPNEHVASASVLKPSNSGRGLTQPERQFFEPRFGRSLNHVRLHNNAHAQQAAASINAKAYALGSDIVLGAKAEPTDTVAGRHLLAHELTHVLQQQGDAGEVIRRVQLTYDDGPDTAGETQRILDALNAADARATFYVVGRRVVEGDNWRTIFNIAKAGHWLGNHAYDWDMAGDNHVFLRGSAQQRAQKILNTEWAIRDALIRGRTEAQTDSSWAAIPQAHRDYINDVIAHGTGRFRTPGFRSKWWDADGRETLAAIQSVNQALAAMGLRPLEITYINTWNITREGVTVDPEDWRAGRTEQEIIDHVEDNTTSNDDTILLHSRLGISADATPEVISHIQSLSGGTFDPTVQGQLGSVRPRDGFAGISSISSPPTPTQLATARKFFIDNYQTIGPHFSATTALGIFQLSHEAGSSEVDAFIAVIRGITVEGENGPTPIANWMMVNQEWNLFVSMFENWRTQRPFPRIPGVTID